MTQSLEDLLSETLRGYAEDTRDVPGMSSRVAQRGQDVRRRRRALVAMVSVVAILGLSATVLPGSGTDRSAPPAKQSTAVSTPEPDPSRPALSPEETAAWLEALPVGAPTDTTHATSRGYAVDGRLEYQLVGDGFLHSPLSTSAGTYFTYERPNTSGGDADHSGYLLHVREVGAVRRVGQGGAIDRFLAPDGETFVVGMYPRPVGNSIGPLEIQVRDVQTGRIMHSLVREAAAPIGWAGDHVVFTIAGLNGDSVWSWLPGEAPERITDGFGAAIAGDLLVRATEADRTDDDVPCPRLVRLDRPEVLLVQRCVQALSPDQRLLATTDYAILDVASDRFLSPALPERLVVQLLGWEADAFVADVSYELEQEDPEAAPESSETVRLRCRADTGRCERVAAQQDLRVVKVRVPN